MNIIPNPLDWLHGPIDFDVAAQQVWDFQLKTNPILFEFWKKLGRKEKCFFPVSFFRDFNLRCGKDWQPELVFRSSGTTGQNPSVHSIHFASIYRESAIAGFRNFYKGDQYEIFALLPGYLDRTDASLVYMVKCWIETFGLPGSGFFLNQFQKLKENIENSILNEKPVLIIGVSFALLDFAEKFKINLPQKTIVIETGGMKGRRKEPVRAELHQILEDAFGINAIQSEFGMTEMLSQAYSHANGKFNCPPWLKIVITDLNHPYFELPIGEAGRINVIDLMNVHSCSFLRTDDLGRIHPDGSFEVLGRIDNSELRGCSLFYV